MSNAIFHLSAVRTALQGFQLGMGLGSWLPVYFWNRDNSSITQTGEYFHLAFTNRATMCTPPAPFIFSEDVLAPQNIARQRETSSLECADKDLMKMELCDQSARARWK